MTRFDDRSTAELFRNPWPARSIVFGALLIGAFAYFQIRYPPLPASKVYGIVVAGHATRNSAEVRLPDGTMVFANNSFAPSLSAGDGVILLKQPSRIGAPSYDVLARNGR